MMNTIYTVAATLLFFVVLGSSQVAWSQAAGNSPPKIQSVAFADPYIYRGVDIEAIPYAEDEEGDYVNYSYRWFLNSEELLDNDTDMLAGNRFSKGDRIALWVIPSDNYGIGPTFYGSDLIVPNAPPVFEAGEPIQFENYQFSFQANATDADDDVLTYSLDDAPVGMVIDQQSGQIQWVGTPEQKGPLFVKVVVTDTDGARAVLPLEIGESEID